MGATSKTWMTWYDMIRRCNNKEHIGYENYGGRGIKVCERWLVYENFLADMGNRSRVLSLERINNEEGYYKENCCWADKSAQNSNKRKYKSNSSGLTGVAYDIVHRKWTAYLNKHSIRFTLYHGRDFFEACCARKSWEAKNV